jgi:NitT/TauT family transport system ATP-binding protein
MFSGGGAVSGNTIGGVSVSNSIMGFSKAEQRERVNRVMDLVDILADLKEISGGNCPAACSNARAYLARWRLITDILLMDEPFGALVGSPRPPEWCCYSGRGPKKTIAFVTHSIPEAVYLSTSRRHTAWFISADKSTALCRKIARLIFATVQIHRDLASRP